MQWVSCCERNGRKRDILAALILRRVKKCRFPGQSPAGIFARHAVIVCGWTTWDPTVFKPIRREEAVNTEGTVETNREVHGGLVGRRIGSMETRAQVLMRTSRGVLDLVMGGSDRASRLLVSPLVDLCQATQTVSSPLVSRTCSLMSREGGSRRNQ